MLGTPTAQQAQSQSSTDSVVEVEANIDDMSPELCEFATEQLFAAGALDVWWTPITMKKGRPALALRVLCPPATQPAVLAALFRETTSIGVRHRLVERTVLARESLTVETEYGPVSVKVARLAGAVVNVAPEFEECRTLALANDTPLKQVFAAAVAAAARPAPKHS